MALAVRQGAHRYSIIQEAYLLGILTYLLDTSTCVFNSGSDLDLHSRGLSGGYTVTAPGLAPAFNGSYSMIMRMPSHINPTPRTELLLLRITSASQVLTSTQDRQKNIVNAFPQFVASQLVWLTGGK